MVPLPLRHLGFFLFFIIILFFIRSGVDSFFIFAAYFLVILVIFVQVKIKLEDAKIMRNGASEER